MNTASKFVGYVGTYTNGESRGLYSFTINTKARKITDVNVAAELENPTYLAISHNRRNLYSVIKKGENGGVASFSMKDDRLESVNYVVSAGPPPCYVSLDSEQLFLFSANYHKGTVESYLVDEKTGAILVPTSVIRHEGMGPNPRQEKAHTHFAGMTSDEKYLVAVDLGCDALISYSVGSSGNLGEVNRLSLEPGSGPRHLTFHPVLGSTAYVMTELSSEVVVLDYDCGDGSFSVRQSVSTLPKEFTGENLGSAIHVSSDGRFVYASNRGHNSIAVFAVDAETGGLRLVEHVSTEGEWPRDFALDPSERFLVAANQNSSNLVLFARDAASGKLTVLQSDIHVPNPVCVKF